MTASVKLTFNSNDYIVRCQTVLVAYSNNITAKPKVNGYSAVEVQTHSINNPIYTLQGVQLTEETGELSYSILLSMIKNAYDGSNGITLTVDYGVSSTKNLVSSDRSTTAIPVVIKTFNFPINVEEIYENNSSARFHLPTLTIVLQETA